MGCADHRGLRHFADALVIAIGSWEFTRRRDVRDEERRHDEREPKIHGDTEPMSGGGWYRLWIELDSSEPLSGLSVLLPDKPEVLVFPDSQDGVELGAPRKTAEWAKPLEGGQRTMWRIETGEWGNETVRIWVTCWRPRRGKPDQTWRVPVDIEGPHIVLAKWV